MFIPKETPTGIVDGNNTIFTLSNNVYQIDDVFIDGVITTDYVLIGNVITFNTAPYVGAVILVDYYTSIPAVVNGSTNTYTLQDVYNACYGIIAQGQDSSAYPPELLKTFINKAQNDICFGNVHNLSTNERLEKQALTFLESNQFYSTHNYSTLANDLIVGATTINCTNNFASTGYVWINGAIISYTGNTGSQLTGIPATGRYSIPFAFIGGTQIYQLDVLPSDFGQTSRAFLTMNTTRNRTALISVDDRDLNSPIPNSYVYRFFFDRSYSNGTGLGREWYYSMIRGQFVFFLVPQTNGQPISFEYQKKPAQLVNPTDLLTIPDEYSLNTIPYMAVAEMLGNRSDMDECVKLNNFGFNNIKSMYQFYSTQRNELMYNQRVRNASEGYLNF